MIAFLIILAVSAILLLAFCYFYPYVDVGPKTIRLGIPILIILASTVGVWTLSGFGFGLATLPIGVIIWLVGVIMVMPMGRGRISQSIIVRLMRYQDLSVPEVTNYLQEKMTRDILWAISGCDDMLKLPPGLSLINPGVYANIRETLMQEVKRRGATHMLSN